MRHWTMVWLPVILYFLVACPILIWSVATFPIHEALPTIGFLAAGLILRSARLNLGGGSFRPTVTAILDASMVLLPIPATILLHGCLALVLSASPRRPLHRTLFNIANFVVLTWVGAALFQYLILVLPATAEFRLLAAALAMLSRFLLNNFFLHVKLASEEGRLVWAALSESLFKDSWASVFLRLVALLILLAYPFAGVWSLAPVVPLMLIFNGVVQFYSQREVLMRQARTDGLTGAYNRSAWDEDAVALASLPGPTMLAVVDMNHLKLLNDKLGHLEGDRAIRDLTHRLSAAVADVGSVYRYGGDEFVVLIPSASKLDSHVIALHRALSEFSRESAVRAIPASASIGIAVAPEDGTTVEELFAVADARMYQHKKSRGLERAE